MLPSHYEAVLFEAKELHLTEKACTSSVVHVALENDTIQNGCEVMLLSRTKQMDLRLDMLPLALNLCTLMTRLLGCVASICDRRCGRPTHAMLTVTGSNNGLPLRIDWKCPFHPSDASSITSMVVTFRSPIDTTGATWATLQLNRAGSSFTRAWTPSDVRGSAKDFCEHIRTQLAEGGFYFTLARATVKVLGHSSCPDGNLHNDITARVQYRNKLSKLPPRVAFMLDDQVIVRHTDLAGTDHCCAVSFFLAEIVSREPEPVS